MSKANFLEGCGLVHVEHGPRPLLSLLFCKQPNASLYLTFTASVTRTLSLWRRTSTCSWRKAPARLEPYTSVL